MTTTRIEISKSYLHFAAAHFTIFGASNRENLHGHNFQVALDATAEIGEDGLTFDYNVLKDAGVITDRFYDYFDRDFARDRNLGRGIYFSRERYGKDVSAGNALRFYGETDASSLAEAISAYPISDAAKKSVVDLLTGDPKPLEGMSNDESEAMLDKLWAHATQESFQWTHEWAGGDFLVWDNRCAMHRRDSVNATQRRVMWRTQFEGEPVVQA